MIKLKIRTAAAVVTAALLCCSAFGQEKPTEVKQVIPGRAPVSYGLVVDNSGSFRLLLDKVIHLISDIVAENEQGDEAFLVTFVDTQKISLRQEFTAEPAEMRDAAENMFIQGGKTAIIDAVKSSADYLRDHAKKDAGRIKVLILVTDGDEEQSETKIESVLATLKDEKIRVFAIALAEGRPVVKLLERFTKESGGKTFAPRNTAELTTSVKLLNEAIRTP